MTRVCDLLQRLNEIIARELLIRRNLWHDVTFAVYHLSPILHSLLTVPRASVHDQLPFRQRECFRLACILYIANLQTKFDPEPGTGMLYGSKLKMILDKEDMTLLWGRSNSLLFWILTMAACSSCLFTDLRSHFVSRLREALQVNDVTPVQGLSSIVHGAMWCREAFQEEMDALAGQLDFHL